MLLDEVLLTAIRNVNSSDGSQASQLDSLTKLLRLDSSKVKLYTTL